MKLSLHLRTIILAAIIGFSVNARGQSGSASATINPLLSFTGDGWFQPGEGAYVYLGTASTERSIAYSRTADHLYLVSRATDGNNSSTHVRILNPTTGAD